MRFLPRFLILTILLSLLVPLHQTNSRVRAQGEETAVIQPVSTRYSLTTPADWTTTNDQIRGLEGIFIDEIVAVGDSAEALTSLGDLDPTKPKLGKTLIANIFPTALAWTNGPTEDTSTLWNNILGASFAEAVELEIDGLPAVQTRDYFGPPYANAEFAGQTMIHEGQFIYYMIYSGQTAAELEELEQIARSFTRNSEPTAAREFSTTDTHLTLPVSADWIVAQGSTGPTESFIIVPDSATTLPYLFGGQYAETLPGMMIQVMVQPYDYLFGTAYTTVTLEDRGAILDQAIGSTGGVPSSEVQEITVGDAPALQVDIENVFNGANRGTIVLIDSQSVMYSVSFVGSAENWEADYAPLVADIIVGMQADVTPPPELAEGELPTGTQRGQQAPDFSTTLVDGTPVNLSDYRGQIVILNFWATWCPPCRTEMPEFQAAAEFYGDDLVILAVNILETPDLIQPFADELGLTIPLALDLDGSINQTYQVTGYPTSYLIDADGVISAVNVGPITLATIEQWVALASE